MGVAYEDEDAEAAADSYALPSIGDDAECSAGNDAVLVLADEHAPHASAGPFSDAKS